MTPTVVAKVFYYTECDKTAIEKFAEYVRETYSAGTYLIKVWDSGNTIGFYKVA
jgi:hypothetical protein